MRGIRFTLMIALAALLLVPACDSDDGASTPQQGGPEGPDTSVLTLRYPNGAIKEQGNVLVGTDTRTGVWKNWHDNGQLESSGRYEDGDKEGVWRYYFANGKPRSVYTYTNGRMDLSQEWTEYNEDGSIRDCWDD